jgi:hypothetical protein
MMLKKIPIAKLCLTKNIPMCNADLERIINGKSQSIWKKSAVA